MPDETAGLIPMQPESREQPDNPEVIRLLRQQAALVTFGSYAFREPVLLNILNEAARVCAEGLGVPYCKICRYRPREGDLLIEAGFGWKPGVIGEVVSRANTTSPQGRAFVTGSPVIIHDLRVAADFELPALYAQYSIISTIDVIIKGSTGEPYGVLEIDSPTRQAYDQNDVTFLSGFANVLAEAVATAERNMTLHREIEMSTALLAERSALAHELPHRVRNNLQLVQGMLADHLKQEAGSGEQPSVRPIIRRVSTLAEVYEQLLGTGLGHVIDLGGYLSALCVSLPKLNGAAQPLASLTCVTEPVPVDLDTVTAIGMVVAELVSNCYEHAFSAPGGRISVSLRRSCVDGGAVLVVADDGTGFVETPGSKRHGVGLVRRLIQQVHGTAEMSTGPGTTWTIRFPAPPPAAHVPPPPPVRARSRYLVPLPEKQG